MQGGSSGSEAEMVQEAGGLEALLDRVSERCEKRVEDSNRKLLGEFPEQADQRAAARTSQSENKLRAEFAAATAAIQGQ
eukprot:12176003-Karenia_brevis.AAC.1